MQFRIYQYQTDAMHPMIRKGEWAIQYGPDGKNWRNLIQAGFARMEADEVIAVLTSDPEITLDKAISKTWDLVYDQSPAIPFKDGEVEAIVKKVTAADVHHT